MHPREKDIEITYFASCLTLKNVESKQRLKMERTEDLELLELQELALRHKKDLPRKSLEEKCMIVKAHLVNHVPIMHLSKEFGIPRTTIWRWIRTFADGKVPDRRKETPNCDGLSVKKLYR